MTTEKTLPVLRDNLSSTLDTLNSTWERINKSLRSLNLPVQASITILTTDDGLCHSYLTWQKYAGMWQVCVRNYSDEFDIDETFPIKDETAEERLRLLDRTDELYNAVLAEADSFIDAANARIVKASKLLDKVEGK
jgi:hypothetical protein